MRPPQDVIQDAIRSENNDQREIAEQGLAFIAELLQKNEDYGSSVFDAGPLTPDLDACTLIRVRMNDKIARIAHLVQDEDGNARVATYEPLTDSIKDLAGYCMLLRIAMMRRGDETRG